MSVANHTVSSELLCQFFLYVRRSFSWLSFHMEGVYVVRNGIVEYFAQHFVPNFAISLICTRTSGNLIIDFLGLL